MAAKLRSSLSLATAAAVLCASTHFLAPGSAQLRPNYYADTCPDVESIVRAAVTAKFQQTFITVPGTIRLFFHDCWVKGCDASIMIASTANNKAEKDHPDNLSLAGDGFDTVIKAKAAVDAVEGCTNMVSCADILVMAARDVIALAGGPSYAVELGRLDGLKSTSASVVGKLPQPTMDLNQLTANFAKNNISQTDMIALSGAHTVGFSHCGRFSSRIYNFSKTSAVDPTMNATYAAQLRAACPPGVSADIAVGMDPVTPRAFDSQYFKNLQVGKGIFTSDESLFTDARSRPLVDTWADVVGTFESAFVAAVTNLGRVGVKTVGDTPSNGNIRRDCAVFNS